MGSWIREHFVTWVIPALETRREWTSKALDAQRHYPVADEALKTTYSEVKARVQSTTPDPTAHDVRYRPSPVRVTGEGPFFRELRLLKEYVAWAELEPMRDPNSHGKPVGQHPGIGAPVSDGWTRLRNSFKSVASYTKKNNLTLLLPGRDVWIYEVMARRYRVPSIFMPEVSRNVADKAEILSKLCKAAGVTGKEVFVDTGFYGSIPKAFSRVLKTDITFLLLSQNRVSNFKWSWSGQPNDTPLQMTTPNQIFPRMKGSRSLALYMEYLPKYWKSGTVRRGLFRHKDVQVVDLNKRLGAEDKQRAIQFLADASEIVEAAIVTSVVWRRGEVSWKKAREFVWGEKLEHLHFKPQEPSSYSWKIVQPANFTTGDTITVTNKLVATTSGESILDYACTWGFIVRAMDEIQARELAAGYPGCEGRGQVQVAPESVSGIR